MSCVVDPTFHSSQEEVSSLPPSAYSSIRERLLIREIATDLVLASVGMSLVMTTYHKEPKMLSGLVRSVLYQFVGRG